MPEVLYVVELVPGSSELIAAVAVPAPNPQPPGQGAEYGAASPIALVVIILLALATALLIRSMSKRIRRLPASFGPQSEQEGGDEEPGRPAGSGAEPGAGPEQGGRARPADGSAGADRL